VTQSLALQSARSHYRRQQRLVQLGAYALLVLVALAFLAPMLLMFMNSFKSDTEMYRNPYRPPETWTLDSYRRIFTHQTQLWQNYLVSIAVAGSSTAWAVLLCSMAAFGFAKFQFKGREIIFSALLATMMVPPEITIPGLYIVFARLHWINKLQAQILPTITPILGLFFMRQYMHTVPDALIEAARIDGAGHLRTFWDIMVPVSSPVLGAYAILHFIGVWNAYTWPILVATRKAVQPVMVVLPQLVDPVIGFLPVWGTIMAGCVLSTMPLLIVFIAFQDTFMSSVVVGSIKG
jgi:ABC-type glycerol-3-phosphate transport system permease component